MFSKHLTLKGVYLSHQTAQNVIRVSKESSQMPLWRNGLACWTSNSKVVGSSPTRGGVILTKSSRVCPGTMTFVTIVRHILGIVALH